MAFKGIDFAKLLDEGPRVPSKVPSLVIGITGHRPHKLDSQGRDPNHHAFDGYRIAVYDGSKGGTGAMVSTWGRFAQPPEHRIDPREYR